MYGVFFFFLFMYPMRPRDLGWTQGARLRRPESLRSARLRVRNHTTAVKAIDRDPKGLPRLSKCP